MRTRVGAAALAWLLSSPVLAQEARPFVAGSWRAILAAHAGRPTIVHFWGMTCGPCRLEMPRWGALLARRGTADFVTVDTDAVAAAPGQAAAFLAGAGVSAAETWSFADTFAEKLYFQVDPHWQGEIPMTALVGRDGHVTRMTGAADMGAVETWLDAQAKLP